LQFFFDRHRSKLLAVCQLNCYHLIRVGGGESADFLRDANCYNVRFAQFCSV